jgi:hypothetical protein
VSAPVTFISSAPRVASGRSQTMLHGTLHELRR